MSKSEDKFQYRKIDRLVRAEETGKSGCSVCKKILPLSAFNIQYNHQKQTQTLRSRCQKCSSRCAVDAKRKKAELAGRRIERKKPSGIVAGAGYKARYRAKKKEELIAAIRSRTCCDSCEEELSPRRHYYKNGDEFRVFCSSLCAITDKIFGSTPSNARIKEIK